LANFGGGDFLEEFAPSLIRSIWNVSAVSPTEMQMGSLYVRTVICSREGTLLLIAFAKVQFYSILEEQ